MTLGHMPEAAKNNDFVSLARQSTLREVPSSQPMSRKLSFTQPKESEGAITETGLQRANEWGQLKLQSWTAGGAASGELRALAVLQLIKVQRPGEDGALAEGVMGGEAGS